MYDKNYLQQIANKLDQLNKANGFNPEFSKKMKELDNYSSDPFGAMGAAGLEYMRKRELEPIDRSIDPLFRDHNN
jgi:hypothetical protein